ncbi:hypothetical protein ACWDUD_05230 [Rhodococcus sp. NPDC003382]
MERARTVASGEPSGRARLTYDGTPDRIAWAVPFTSGWVYVAGTAAWPA